MLPNTSRDVQVPKATKYRPNEFLRLIFKRLLVYWMARSKKGAMETARANLHHSQRPSAPTITACLTADHGPCCRMNGAPQWTNEVLEGPIACNSDMTLSR